LDAANSGEALAPFHAHSSRTRSPLASNDLRRLLRDSGRAYALQNKYAIHNRHGSAHKNCQFSIGIGIRSRALDSRFRKKVYSLLASACGSSS